MVTKILAFFHRRVSRPLTRREPYFQWRSLSYTIDLPSEYLSSSDHSFTPVHSISSNPSFALLGFCKNIDYLKKVHALFFVSGIKGDLLCDTKLVSLYGTFGHVGCARLVFDRISEPDFYSWKVMIRWYFLNDLYTEIIGFYARMRMSVGPCDNVVFSIVLRACSELQDIDEGRKVHCEIIKLGNPDSFVQTGLVNMYAKCSRIECSRKAFGEILYRNVVSWTSMLAGYVQNDCSKEALVLFNRMREEMVESNHFTLVSLVTACGKLGALHQGKWVHGYVIKTGIELDSYLVTAVLDMYVKCGNLRDARSVFDKLSSVDLVSWTAMIVGYSQSGFPDKALKLFVDKIRFGIFPNAVTIASLLSACAQLTNLSIGRLVHSLGIRLGVTDPTVVNALVDLYAKCGAVREARYIFETVSDKNLIAWNSIIYGYTQNGFAYDALKLFHRMRSKSMSPDAVTLVSILSACASLGALQVGSSLHAYSIKAGLLSSSVYVGTALLNFYAKCGDSKSARVVFDSIGEKNTVTWSAMIGGYGIQGESSGSLALFSDMIKENLEPNEVIFTTILSACSHTGRLGEGWKCFNSMCQDYNFVPSVKHYACMVDMLARAGLLEEAFDFIEKLPFKPHHSLFGAFLHGCGLHSRFDLGEAAIKKMLDLHPDKACYYVLISNLYASDGRWAQVNQVRELMKQRGLSKDPGCSITEMETNKHLSFARVACLA
ncbi:Pentatricopeptide repeat-containing protein [Hibiscus syriacus]|uniref:Pentatricopeptide repeat-containing protein n=1 Tax=Hibiscus syriacus TaxID=106335 RepID=A0A6A3BG53_HIBSY|nr:pentatricopeptide repeat-containing protein At2g03380, mitochondrial [Hibiscus syriacus]KAE8716110.1 Pentatricopeptide repeat-containing protein [Hibiscus syriacus]